MWPQSGPASKKIYPHIWDGDEDELRSELSTYLNALRALVQAASERGERLLIWIR